MIDGKRAINEHLNEEQMIKELRSRIEQISVDTGLSEYRIVAPLIEWKYGRPCRPSYRYASGEEMSPEIRRLADRFFETRWSPTFRVFWKS